MKHTIVFLIFLSVLNCNSDITGGFKILINSSNSSISLDNEITIDIKSSTNKVIDSVNYFLNDIKTTNKIKLNDNKVGENLAKVDIYSNGKKFSLNKKFDIFSNIKPELMTYEIVEEYRHDQEAYTQGLEIYNNFLFESTGLNGKSSVRKINMKSGEILDIINLDYEYFGEGLTILNDRIYQLTWKNRIGFIYDLDLNKIATFNYKNSQEGWGLCNDGEYLYKSDGTSKIWRLNPNTLEEIDFVDVMTDKSRIKNINELEFIDGKIYANTYQFNRDVVIVINPSNGVVEKVIDFSGIRDKVLQTPDIDVMNGIAYNRGKIFVTGKNWNKVFEVKVYSKN
ncbi:MAG: glutaminyl-peptide cyclotransferase [Cryomorphaceae bacterium]|jgi:glutaminyl-peptide cyclotransferase|nr:glutaminyl-peptide cyclotransferase [Cryomorphaceae bacterium]MBT3503342.1 glutaminyl-peptide cyclotransferase [Cryomorphaceae bacterium]MBT3688515.1 glutaminyl-peptide cyclotransferase [Cryomorphaceae bacterium]MBT4221989.1 glutaminyl-peptide cyclotransferase [Cryomorphaceae bacterium]MBT4293991.1 glutaminyl-peptide cyclotransferase [Cryomorphaceae bacterium]|tara:strand:+ start:3022 stop:4038 length:1017 start_codon:yes stop_codon:yes gene_type:complete